MNTHTQKDWTASIGSKGAHINVGNIHSHPLSFGFHWDEHNAELRKEGQANARLIAGATKLYDELWHIHYLLEKESTVTIEAGTVTADRIRRLMEEIEREE